MSAAVTCPSCAGECPDGARFCPGCGAPLAALAPHAVERKVVTTMFCDLVGFTGFCEQVDPEEADRVLREFYAVARRAIETYGGVVEKFVGDAVVGIFGVPAAHEDDPERAVLTAIRLRDQVPMLSTPAGRRLEIRIGINTGIAVVRHDVAPGSGEGFLVGDAVNTAARLQKLAPPTGVVVGEKTHGLTTRRIAYEARAPASVKGKRGAVKCWLAKGPISRMGVDLRQEFPAPLVGREVELGILKGLLKKVRVSSQPQFAIVVGDAGIGKSRLMFEFVRYIDSRPAIVRWRQGRCPAYGDGLTFWSLGEIVKEQLGVAELDDVAAIEVKLGQALAGVDDREWLAARLRPLLGLESPAAARDENFAAWRRFLEIVAGDSPAVVVFEDLHWASEGTLAFLRHLVENAADVPLLAVGTTRPELLHVRPDVAAHLVEVAASQQVVRIDLEPLSESETEELVSRVGHGLRELRKTRQAIVRRAAGNALYAEQLVRLLEDESSNAHRATNDVALKERVARALPESLQSLIAARLDELPPARKALLGDAAVVGEVFWTGAVAALDHGDGPAIEEGLADLVRRDLVRHDRESSVAGEREFTFRHALIREVAYAQLTRADRAAKHAAVARWVEAVVGERVDEVAEILAHHYVTALGLAEAVGDQRLRGELLKPAVHALRLAGDRALPLDVAAAERHYAHAVGLSADAAERPQLLVSWADALAQCGDLSRAANLLEEGIRALRLTGDTRALAVSLMRLSDVLWLLSDSRAWDCAVEALALVKGDGPSATKVRVMEDWAWWNAVTYEGAAAIEAADEARALSTELGLPDSGQALGARGMARCDLGDEGGLDDLRRGLRMVQAQGLGREAGGMFFNLSDEIHAFHGPRAALTVLGEGVDYALQRGDEVSADFLRLSVVNNLMSAGEWNEALALSDQLGPVFQERGEVQDRAALATTRSLILVRGGRHVDLEELLALCRQTTFVDLGDHLAMQGPLAAVQLAHGDRDGALGTLAAMVSVRDQLASCPQFGMSLPIAVAAAVAAHELDLALRLVDGFVPGRAVDAHTLAWLRACILEHDHDHASAAEAYVAAAAAWSAFGAPFEHAQALLAAGRCLFGLGRRSAARRAVRKARDLFIRLGARPAVAAAEALLEQRPAGPPG